MKNLIHLSITIFLSIILSSCASIFGGAKYKAHIKVPHHPYAKIEYNGEDLGRGDTIIKIKRIDADNITITVSEKACETQTFNFTNKKFREWAFSGTVVSTSLFSLFLMIPVGIIEGQNGCWWKPDKHEEGITKINLDNYVYTIDYSGCEDKE